MNARLFPFFSFFSYACTSACAQFIGKMGISLAWEAASGQVVPLAADRLWNNGSPSLVGMLIYGLNYALIMNQSRQRFVCFPPIPLSIRLYTRLYSLD